jgi:alpha-tubulin suppressor-like RCC1 family protein
MKRIHALRPVALLGLLVLAQACSDDAGTGPTPVVAAVQVNPGAISLAEGGSTQLQATVRDASGQTLSGRAVAWTSSLEAVAKVGADGTVTAVAPGVAKITATSEGKSGTATVTVTGQEPEVPAVADVKIVTALDTLEAHDTRLLQAILKDADGNVLTGRVVTWTSSDPAVAAVEPETGMLTGLDRGTVTITATSEGKSDQVTRVVVIRYRSVSAGTMHACDIASGGIVWCWGLNGRQGRIGLERLVDDELSTEPVRLSGSHRFTQLATYGVTTCGITTQGAAYCWGSNNWGALGTGATTPAQSFTPVAVTGGHKFQQIVAGGGHLCGLTVAGHAYCWGTNGSGELGNGLRQSSATPVRAAPSLTFTTLAAGAEYTCGTTAAGQAWCWGYDGLGTLGDGRPISYGNTYSLSPVQVAGGATFAGLSAGQQHTCGVTTAGQGFCWGRNGNRFGNGGTADSSTPEAVAGGHSFRTISAGALHTCGVTQLDEVLCWGANGNGQLGQVMVNGSTSPVRAGGAIRAAEVSAANISTGHAAYTCAISADRLTTWCWGRNEVGQLGNGTTSTATAVNAEPTIVVGQKPLD